MSDDSFQKRTLADFLDQLGSAAPTPGGGSVAALAGALAAGLGRMVAALTLGKPRFAEVESAVQNLADRIARSEQMLRQLIDEDAGAYRVLSVAFKLDKSDPAREQQIQEAAVVAGSVPLETVAVVANLIGDLHELETLGNPLLKSDAQAGQHLARAALHAAAVNVRANLSLMPDDAARAIGEQLDKLVSECR